MSLKFDRCPRCRGNFEDCACSLGQVEQFLAGKQEESRTLKLVQREMDRRLTATVKRGEK